MRCNVLKVIPSSAVTLQPDSSLASADACRAGYDLADMPCGIMSGSYVGRTMLDDCTEPVAIAEFAMNEGRNILSGTSAASNELQQ